MSDFLYVVVARRGTLSISHLLWPSATESLWATGCSIPEGEGVTHTVLHAPHNTRNLILQPENQMLENVTS